MQGSQPIKRPGGLFSTLEWLALIGETQLPASGFSRCMLTLFYFLASHLLLLMNKNWILWTSITRNAYAICSVFFPSLHNQWSTFSLVVYQGKPFCIHGCSPSSEWSLASMITSSTPTQKTSSTSRLHLLNLGSTKYASSVFFMVFRTPVLFFPRHRQSQYSRIW